MRKVGWRRCGYFRFKFTNEVSLKHQYLRISDRGIQSPMIVTFIRLNKFCVMCCAIGTWYGQCIKYQVGTKGSKTFNQHYFKWFSGVCVCVRVQVCCIPLSSCFNYSLRLGAPLKFLLFLPVSNVQNRRAHFYRWLIVMNYNSLVNLNNKNESATLVMLSASLIYLLFCSFMLSSLKYIQRTACDEFTTV